MEKCFTCVCRTFSVGDTMKIALSKGSGSPKYERYAEWLKRIESDIEIVDLSKNGYDTRRALEELVECAGVVFTGGADIDPALYGAEQLRPLCGTIDRARDDFEFALLERARSHSMPVLGICRGLQLVNVASGGSLIADIPSHMASSLEHRKLGDTDSEHAIEIEAGTTLGKMLRAWEGTVNSAHHQAIERLGSGIRVAATAPDGIIEAVETDAPETSGFLVAVQWHPERMRQQDSPFSRTLGERFLFECRSYWLLIRGRAYDREGFMSPPENAAHEGGSSLD